MQRWFSILLGLGACFLAVAVVARAMTDGAAQRATEAHAAGADSGAVAAPHPDAGKPSQVLANGAHDAGPTMADLGLLDAPTDPSPVGAGAARFPDGRPVPPLPEGAPKHVKLGVVLMGFAGAQGFPPNARPKKEAAELAGKLAADAKGDFHAAVIRGDSGSADDIGRLPRGVLEPYLEYLVFSLPVGGVTDAIETPRGFWIARRAE